MPTVSFDSNYKTYTWNFTDWFKYKEFNSIAEIIIAYLEQIILVRYWFYKEENKNNNEFNQLKNNPSTNFTIDSDFRFNELFENRNKLIDYLKEVFPKKTLFDKDIIIENIIKEVKNDPAISSKINHPVQEHFRYFYKQKQTEILDFANNEYSKEIIKNIISIYEKCDKKFIDSLIFISLNKLNNLEDFVFNKIYFTLLNMHSDKNALDLIEDIDYEEKDKSNKNKGVKRNHSRISGKTNKSKKTKKQTQTQTLQQTTQNQLPDISPQNTQTN